LICLLAMYILLYEMRVELDKDSNRDRRHPNFRQLVITRITWAGSLAAAPPLAPSSFLLAGPPEIYEKTLLQFSVLSFAAGHTGGQDAFALPSPLCLWQPGADPLSARSQ
jgi:hypothetical protein